MAKVAVKKTAGEKAAPKKQVAATKATKPTGQVIHLLVKENPKRGASRDRYALYRDGMSVDQYIDRVVKAGVSSSAARADLRWDVEREFIAIK